MNEAILTGQHLSVWNTLENMKEGQRVIGRDLMAASAIKEQRTFFAIIEDLRSEGFQIGASKSLYDPGYYQMRTDTEVMGYYFDRVSELEKEIAQLRKNAESYFKKKYGESFDFIAYKAKEELKRLGKTEGGDDNA